MLIYAGLYNASKAALMAYSETLKLEMSPFDVKVMSLVTGSIDTTIMSHGELTLPENSLYKKAHKEIQDRGNGIGAPSKTAPVDFAKQVVKDILHGTNGPIWRGAMASVAWYMSKFMPVWLMVSKSAVISPVTVCNGLT